MKYSKTHSRATAAAKAGVSARAARKYLQVGGQMENGNMGRTWRTRKDVFVDVWSKIESMLAAEPGLQSQTVMQWLIDQDEQFTWGQLRTLQRRLCKWRALEGPDKEVMFQQVHIPGKQSQSDWTHCNELEVIIDGNLFLHMLFHFMLPYSRWETAYIGHSESFESLTSGYMQAVAELGAVPAEHRTDNLTAAVNNHGNRHVFNKRWEVFLGHYGATASKNNPGVSHENGSVEKSHDLLKNALDQALKLRGSRNFVSVAEYGKFIRRILDQRNRGRRQRLAEEVSAMKELPERGWNDPRELQTTVTAFSTVSVEKVVYSVPSRLIGRELRVLIYPEAVRLFLGDTLVQEMPRQQAGSKKINYRHVVSHLVRKPGAFANYQYREELFPSLVFRKAHDALKDWSPSRADKEYLSILHYAAMGSEQEVQAALEVLLESSRLPLLSSVKELVGQHSSTVPDMHIAVPDLCSYDVLLTYLSRTHKEVIA